MEDERFQNLLKDPKYRRIPKREEKIKIDERFQSMFKDKKFKNEYTTDKRGRPVNSTSTEDLKKYYEISSEEESSDSDSGDDKAEADNSANESTDEQAPVRNTLDKKGKSDKVVSDRLKQKLKNLDIDYARGESILCSESSSDDDEDDEDTEGEASESEEIDHKWGELDVGSEQTEEITYRLAACNMDWDRIRAIDLMVLFNSFLPPGGVIKSVIIYPSEFGKKRMAEEETKGPIELVESTRSKDEKNENEEGSSYHMEKLRQYQLNRLKYYYAIITFDTPNSANKIYTECDGMEYESSATKMDLRFVPDDMTFDDEPKETCDSLPDGSKYQPRFFTTTALQQAKVNLTWDETNPERLEIAEKLRSGKVDGVSETDLQNYLASSSEEDDDVSDEETEHRDVKNETGGGTSIDKYKALLQDIEEKEKRKNNREVEMEISWGIDLQEKTDKLIKEKMTSKDKQTPFEQYLEKRREKNRGKREERKKKNTKDSDDGDSDIPSDVDMNDKYFAEEFENSDFKQKKKKQSKKSGQSENVEKNQQKDGELELLLMDESDNKEHFSLKKIQEREKETKSKKKKRKNKYTEDNEKASDNFEINVADERFSALFTSHHFNIDPTDPHYKNTKAMETLVGEKLKRRSDSNSTPDAKKFKVENKKNAELNLLVKSVKRKVDAFKNKK